MPNIGQKDDSVTKFSFAFAACATVFAAASVRAEPVPLRTQPPPPRTAAPLQAAPLPGSGVTDPVSLGYARQIAAATLSPERRQEITQGLTQTVMAQIRASPIGQSNDPGLKRIMDDFVGKLPDQIRPVGERNMPWITEAIAKAYAQQFSIEELRQISEFAKTPAGAHFVSRVMTIVSDPEVVRANQTFFNDAMQAANVGAPQLRVSVTDYLSKHPDVARQIQAQAEAHQQQQGQRPQQATPPH